MHGSIPEGYVIKPEDPENNKFYRNYSENKEGNLGEIDTVYTVKPQ